MCCFLRYQITVFCLYVCVYGPGVRTLSVAELNERLAEMDTNIRRFSEELVQQLALRDELEFEKEVKNSFISTLIDVQNRQKEHRELLKKKKKLKGGAGTSQGHAEKTFGSVSTLYWWNVALISSNLCFPLFAAFLADLFFQQTVFSSNLFRTLINSLPMLLRFASFLLSASAWRGCHLSFRTASGTLLGVGAVKNRLLCSQLLSFFFLFLHWRYIHFNMNTFILSDPTFFLTYFS